MINHYSPFSVNNAHTVLVKAITQMICSVSCKLGYYENCMINHFPGQYEQ